MRKGKKCVVVLSGGPDSAVVAHWAKKEGFDVHGLCFKYGQIAVKELECADIIAQKLNIPLKIVDISSLKDIFVGVTSLCDESIEMTQGFSHPIIVPFRNAIFLSIAVAYSQSIDALKIFYGAHSSDQPFYPDCREEFYKSFETTARLGTDKQISVEAPFGKLSKALIMKEGLKLGVPFEFTWSCYLNGTKHCGECESCTNRKNAFQEAKICDPTEYMK